MGRHAYRINNIYAASDAARTIAPAPPGVPAAAARCRSGRAGSAGRTRRAHGAGTSCGTRDRTAFETRASCDASRWRSRPAPHAAPTRCASSRPHSLTHTHCMPNPTRSLATRWSRLEHGAVEGGAVVYDHAGAGGSNPSAYDASSERKPSPSGGAQQRRTARDRHASTRTTSHRKSRRRHCRPSSSNVTSNMARTCGQPGACSTWHCGNSAHQPHAGQKSTMVSAGPLPNRRCGRWRRA